MNYTLDILNEMKIKPATAKGGYLESGLESLDSVLNGFRKGGLYFLTGKNSFEIECLYVHLLSNISKQANIYCHCHDIAAEALTEALLSNETNINGEKIKRRVLDEDEIEKVNSWIEKKNVGEIVFNNSPFFTFKHFLETVQDLTTIHSFRIIAIDNIFSFLESLNEPFEAALYNLKQFAITNNIAVIATHNLSQKNNPYEFASFKDDLNTREIKKYFDVIITTYRQPWNDSESMRNNLSLVLEKNRFGSTTTIEMNADFCHSKLIDIEFSFNY